MPKKKGKSFRVLFTRPALLLAVIFLAVGGWLTYRTLSSPLGINELSVFDEKNSKVVTSQIGAICAQVYGHCLGYDNKCITYTDSCVQAKVCAQPFKSCNEPVPTREPLGTPITSPNTTPPSNCISWFDGCNTCQVKDGVIMGCTKMACKMDATARPYCLAYDNTIVKPTPPPTTPPPGCISWFDGCNTCKVAEGGIMACTKIACRTQTEPPRCLIYSDTKPTPIASSSPIVNGISNFQAVNPCGTTGFYNYAVQCNNGTKKDLSSGTCSPLAVTIKYAEQFCRTEYQ